MISPSRVVIPGLFYWLLLLEAPLVATTVYSSVYVFGVGTTPFILALIVVSPAGSSSTWTQETLKQTRPTSTSYSAYTVASRTQSPGHITSTSSAPGSWCVPVCGVPYWHTSPAI
ncbi:uncharacterized protein THITE_2115597 [Thermothielavioides terrestris NRRL 8126]|uniref:Uncharacterized protein n=1 Tax=Thermothielavioides terrestris (strain ATCC 38088 / NRRL 8126) TaxID=578455 RepID=G2R4Y4_THETT|nr:uncharacterized protein THITE_2115597 [Thermothielavioides terrestris NRRL 8126]AEO66969.1 hypothetical protein THITE_2115597 [Thermothielavioides terrestris NRRL 8126]